MWLRFPDASESTRFETTAGSCAPSKSWMRNRCAHREMGVALVLRFTSQAIVACLFATPALTAQNQAASATADSPGALNSEGKLPPLPAGPSTVIGGTIRDVDLVLDRFTLSAYGQKPFKVFFDERTALFRDGKRISLREFQPCQHASVQTTLDGTSVFAVSIHVLSQAVPGDYEGEVLSYDPASGELSVALSAGRKPVTLLVTGNTVIVREGQEQFRASPSGPADLRAGTLVSIKFDSDNRGHGVATRIAIRATAGADFLFSGDVLSIDAQAGTLVLVDTRDDKRYQFSFDPREVPSSLKIHRGEHVRVRAEYDGTQYQAREISAY
jgi:hypothetical protein